MYLLVIVPAFLFAAGVAWVALESVFGEERQVRRAVRSLSDYEAEELRQAEPLLRSLPERIGEPAGKVADRLVGAFAPDDYRERLRHRLLQAGEPFGMKPAALLTAKVLSVPVAAVVLGPLSLFLLVIGSRFIAFVLGVLVLLAYFAPDLWLSRIASRRAKAIRAQLPDALDMLSISVQAGLGLDQAIAKLVSTMRGVLPEEFAKMLLETQAGVARRDALRNLAARADVPELTAFIVSLLQADAFGVTVSDVLTTQAEEMRRRRRQNAEETAQKAPVKLVFPIILCMLPATLIVLVGPGVISIIRLFLMMR